MRQLTEDPGTCLFCGEKLSFLQRRLFKQQFCSPEHAREFRAQNETMALACLQQFAGAAAAEKAKPLPAPEAAYAEPPAATQSIPPAQAQTPPMEQPPPEQGYLTDATASAVAGPTAPGWYRDALDANPGTPRIPSLSLADGEWERITADAAASGEIVRTLAPIPPIRAHLLEVGLAAMERPAQPAGPLPHPMASSRPQVLDAESHRMAGMAQVDPRIVLPGFRPMAVLEAADWPVPSPRHPGTCSRHRVQAPACRPEFDLRIPAAAAFEAVLDPVSIPFGDSQ